MYYSCYKTHNMLSSDVIGHQLKRLLGFDPVRFRRSPDETKFLLSDCDNASAGELVLDTRCLQLAGSDCSPLVIDIDSLNSLGKIAASDAAFSSERLQCATRLIGAVLNASYGLTVQWFSSGKQGVHGWAFGSSLSSPARQLVARLLPEGGANSADTLSMFMRVPAYSHPLVQAEVEAGLARLLTLSTGDCTDTEWTARLRAAAAPNASLATKLLALTAFFDVGVTAAGRLRVPCSYNEKDAGYVGFPLPAPSLDASWPTLRRDAKVALSTDELKLLETIPLPTSTQRDATLAALQADLGNRKRALSESEGSELAGERASIPRLHPRNVALPSDTVERLALIPTEVRARLPAVAVAALERGITRGGMPPCDWRAESDDQHRHDASVRGGGVEGVTPLPLALDALCGLNLTARGRGDTVRSLVASAFPVDCFAEAMLASRRMRELKHWASWFSTFAKGKSKADTVAWRYDAGRLDSVGVQCPMVRSQCARAAQLLSPTGGGGGGNSGKANRPAAASKLLSGRTVNVKLVSSKEEMLKTLQTALAERAEGEATDSVSADTRLAALSKRVSDDLNQLYRNSDGNGIVSFTEYISSEGRFSYSSGSFQGVKSLLREVRAAVFQGAWRVDLKRCHTSMLLGAYSRAVKLGIASEHAVLTRMSTDLDGVEAELADDQTRLLPAVMARLESVRGTPNETNAAKLVAYLQSPPKTLLSAMLNHPNESPMFKTWPLAASCCRALGMAAGIARSHPLVAADQRRPQLTPETCPRGSAKEKQRIAFILERRAVGVLVAELTASGMAPSLTINDEALFWPANEPDIGTLEAALAMAVSDKLGFDAPLRVERV